FLEVLRHDLVDQRKMSEVGQVNIELHDIRQRSARSPGHCGEILEHTPNLRLRAARHELPGRRIQRKLTRAPDRRASRYCLTICSDRGGRFVGMNGPFSHLPPFQLLLRVTRTTPRIVRMLRITWASCLRSRTRNRNSSAEASPSESTCTWSMLLRVAEMRPATSARSPRRSKVRT